MKAILLTDIEMNSSGGWVSKQYSEALKGCTGIQDNGGQPDGNAWIIWDVSDAEARDAVALGAKAITVFYADYEAEPWNEVISQFASGDEWAGVGSQSEAVFTNRKDAELCQRCADLWRGEHGGDLETIAYLVATPEEEWVLA